METLTLKQKIILQQIKGRLEKVYRVHQIYLYGSQAKGSAAPTSDFDVLVTLDEPVDYWRLREKISDLMYELELEHDIIIDLRVYNKNEINQGLYPVLPFMRAVLTEGILYE